MTCLCCRPSSSHGGLQSTADLFMSMDTRSQDLKFVSMDLSRVFHDISSPSKFYFLLLWAYYEQKFCPQRGCVVTDKNCKVVNDIVII